MVTDCYTIADRLEYVMHQKGYSSAELRPKMGELCGISRQAISKWFGGGTNAPLAVHIEKIGTHCNGNLAWIITGKGDPFEATREADDNSSESSKSQSFQQGEHNYNRTYSFKDKEHRDALGEAVQEGVNLGNG